MGSVWGIHGRKPEFEMVRDHVIQLERPGIGDLREFGNDRERVLKRLRASYPRAAEGTLRNWTTVLLRFAFSPSVGDIVVHPDPRTRTVSIGRISGSYRFNAAERQLHERDVGWLVTGVSRDRLSPAAAADIAQRVAFFAVRRTAKEFALLARVKAV